MSNAPPSPPSPPIPPIPPQIPFNANLTGPVLTCNNPNCGHVGPTRIEEHGSIVGAVLIMVLCMLIPGLLYLLLGCYKTYHCAACNALLQKAGFV